MTLTSIALVAQVALYVMGVYLCRVILAKVLRRPFYGDCASMDLVFRWYLGVRRRVGLSGQSVHFFWSLEYVG